MFGWRRLLLRLFGAEIASDAIVHSTCKIYAPWNLSMASKSCLSHGVDCYSVARISLGTGATVSQLAVLCTASHNWDVEDRPTIASPIVLADDAWVCHSAFVGPGVHVGCEAILGARAVTTKDLPPRAVAVGNPASILRTRP